MATNFRQGVHLKSHSIRETHEERPNFVIEWQQRQGWCLDVCHRVKTCMILKNIIIIFDIFFLYVSKDVKKDKNMLSLDKIKVCLGVYYSLITTVMLVISCEPYFRTENTVKLVLCCLYQSLPPL